MATDSSSHNAQDTYFVQLIQLRDGSAIPDAVRSYLEHTGAIFDPKLCGFVVSDGGLPAAYMIFLSTPVCLCWNQSENNRSVTNQPVPPRCRRSGQLTSP